MGNEEAAILNQVSQIRELPHRFIQLEEGFIDDTGGLCIVTELINGFDLLQLAETSVRGLSEAIVKTLMKQIIEAIQVLHKNDIAHLDLKLENIMLDKDSNEIKIIDFGFASNCRI